MENKPDEELYEEKTESKENKEEDSKDYYPTIMGVEIPYRGLTSKYY
jgi:hypothetical protein